MAYTVTLPILHAGQQQLMRESRRYNVPVCGRRFGKTFLAQEVLLDGPRQKGALNGYPVALYAPTYQTMLESWRTLCRTLKDVTAQKSEQNKRLDLITGGSVECYSLDDPDASRGRKFAVAVIDEAAMIKRLEEAWEQTIQPLLLDFQGEAWFFSTPKGDNYFKKLFDKGNPANPNRDDEWQSWQLPTITNPHISKRDVDKMKEGLPRLVAMQEFDAQFVSFAGTFIKAEHIRVGQAPRGMRLYQGVDLAISMKQNADYTAIVTVGVDDQGRVWIVDAERRRVGFRDALAFIKEKAARYRPQEIAIEAVQYQAAVVEELLRSTDLPVRQVKPDKDKFTRAQTLITRYENGLVWHNETLPSYFVEEMLAFGPDCEHDDLLDAAVYAYSLCGEYGRTQFILPEHQAYESKIEIVRSMHGLPSQVAQMVDTGMEQLQAKLNGDAGTCGACSSFDGRSCTLRGFTVNRTDPGCEFYA
jgi:predicted phage terminase large subunit-like protein